MSLSNKKIAFFVADLYNAFEFWYPYYRMKEEEADVVAIGPEKNIYTGKYGIPVTVDEGISDVGSKDFDAVIIPGGYAPDYMRRKKEMVDFVKEMYDQDKVIAAICHAGWMLVSADIVRDKTVTSFFSIRDDLTNAGARWIDKDIVIDGTLIKRIPRT